MTIKGKPDVSAFLEGGSASEKRSEQKMPVAGVPKRKKLVELPEPVFAALKEHAYLEFKKSGVRVTETQIIIDALSSHLGLK